MSLKGLNNARQVPKDAFCLDQKAKVKLKAEEKKLSKFSSAMLTGVGQRYTLDSDEYEQAGGTRESERKKPGRAPKAPKAGQ